MPRQPSPLNCASSSLHLLLDLLTWCEFHGRLTSVSRTNTPARPWRTALLLARLLDLNIERAAPCFSNARGAARSFVLSVTVRMASSAPPAAAPSADPTGLWGCAP